MTRDTAPAREGHRRALAWGILGLLALSALAVAILFFVRLAGEKPSHPGSGAEAATPGSFAGAAPAKKRPWHPWPPKEKVIGPPAGSMSSEEVPAAEASKEADAPAKENPPGTAPKPTPEEMREVAGWKPGDAETLKKAQGVLLDPGASSTLKLAVIGKVQSMPSGEAVPLLIRFLESPTPEGDAQTKPTAVKAIVDFNDALADKALSQLAATSKDERVRTAIASLLPAKRR